MHIILLSGGSGKRLWPLSNDIRSKQFLRVLKGPNGEMESMVQRVYRQLDEVGLSDSVTVVAGQSQKEQVVSQLGSHVNLVIEPERRDTFPAIALACVFLKSEYQVDLDESVIVLPVDPFVENDFFENIKKLGELVASDDVDLALLGALPTYPSEKYGYIVPRDKGHISDVLSFKEKPSEEKAHEFISMGALWNCGVFGFKLKYVLNIIENEYDFEQVDYTGLYRDYQKFKKISFDYAVVEKTEKIKSIVYSGMWKDLGTWNTLTEEMEVNAYGQVLFNDECNDTHVINELAVPVVAMGMEDSVIVASHDGILVAKKNQTPKLKNFISEFDNMPRYQEKRWGVVQVLYHNDTSEIESCFRCLYIQKGHSLSVHKHLERKEVWTVVSGSGLVNINGVDKVAQAGDVVVIEPGEVHSFKADTDVELTEVQIGKKLKKMDKVLINL